MHPTGKNLLKPVVIARRRNQAATGGEIDRRVWRAVRDEPTGEFGGKISRIGSTPPIPSNKELPTAIEALGNGVGGVFDGRLQGTERADRLEGAFNGAGDWANDYLAANFELSLFKELS